jgi:hypothetical protein
MCGVFAIVRIWVFDQIDGKLAATLNVIFGIVIAVLVIWFVAELLMCVIGVGGLGYPGRLR